MIGDFNLTDPEIYKVQLEVDEVPQHGYILVSALCQLRFFTQLVLENIVYAAEHSHSSCLVFQALTLVTAL